MPQGEPSIQRVVSTKAAPSAQWPSAIYDLIRHITANMGLMWNMWCLDDGLLVGSFERISQALAYLEMELLKRGLNRAKSNLWGPAAPLVSGSECMKIIPWQPNSGVTILGSPVPFPGSTAYVEDDWKRRLGSLEEAADRVTGLADKQMAHHLLRSCLDGCKINHLLRATDTYQLDLLVRRADDIIMSAFEDVVGCGLSPNSAPKRLGLSRLEAVVLKPPRCSAPRLGSPL